MLQVGGMVGVIVLDTSEDFSRKAGADDATISQYKTETLPVLAHYDDHTKLDMVGNSKHLHIDCNLL